VEGFYKTCELIGKGKQYNLMIPCQNVQNLMLHDDVRKAVANKQLNIYPISHISEAFELATGVPLGMTEIHQEEFAKGSALAIIREKLDRIHAEQHKDRCGDDEDEDQGHKSRKAAKSRLRSRQIVRT
jgi:predicted ATP-dependent protease